MAKTSTKPAKKRNPNDTTFRNLTALKRRVARLEDQVEHLLQRAHSHATAQEVK